MPKPSFTASVHAVVVNWNGGELAVQSIRSLVEQSHPVHVWLVDNGSVDGSADAIASAFPGVEIIRNAGNLGFAAANNQALARAGNAHIVLLVNNDAILPDRESIARLVEFFDAHPDEDGVCGRYEYPDGTFQHFYNQLPTASDIATLWGILGHSKRLRTGSGIRRYQLADADFSRPMYIEQPAFACVALRGKSIAQLGYLDEQFPVFFNDVDYCWRWRDSGRRWYYLPTWRIVHHKSQSTTRLADALDAELRCSAVRFARKHLRPLQASFVRGAIVVEAAWRRLRHRGLGIPLSALWRGDATAGGFDVRRSRPDATEL